MTSLFQGLRARDLREPFDFLLAFRVFAICSTTVKNIILNTSASINVSLHPNGWRLTFIVGDRI